MRTNFILYVSDQMASARFYEAVLMIRPSLDVPGMTEFKLSAQTVLGLMPVAGVRRLLGTKLRDPDDAKGVPRAEIYLSVDDPQSFHQRALAQGAAELSPLAARDWGDEAAYSTDLDGHVLVFAKRT
jgi:uncharacterized glyoxalase superfamily protein PhnB